MFHFIRRLRESRKRRKEQVEQERAAALEKFTQRQMNPQYDLIAEIYGKPISQSLRALYDNKVEILKENVEKIVPGQSEDRWLCISWYDPMDREHIEEQWNPESRCYEFADDGSGSKYVVDPTDDNAQIYYFDHEGQEMKPTGATMVQFLSLEESHE
ncbi:MAG: SMI1/KNR4 family protein [Planctomycetaceae bacterium]|nr:SMI1/KNR4 family protein [Planctomycetaceae bacterium]